jgi:hypothetical protein
MGKGPTYKIKRGYCRWCGCRKAAHTGRVPGVTRANMPGQDWTTTACDNLLHEHILVNGCRRYEV